MSDIYQFLTDTAVLSNTGLFGAAFDLLGKAGSWADAASKLLGLVG